MSAASKTNRKTPSRFDLILAWTFSFIAFSLSTLCVITVVNQGKETADWNQALSDPRFSKLSQGKIEAVERFGSFQSGRVVCYAKTRFNKDDEKSTLVRFRVKSSCPDLVGQEVTILANAGYKNVWLKEFGPDVSPYSILALLFSIGLSVALGTYAWVATKRFRLANLNK